MIVQKHDESRRQAVIQGPHGNHTKPDALTMATELVRGNMAKVALELVMTSTSV